MLNLFAMIIAVAWIINKINKGIDGLFYNYQVEVFVDKNV